MLFGRKYKKVLIVEGMHCKHCAKKVEDSLKEIDGVSSVKVNLDKEEVMIISKVELDNDAIVGVIKSLDYEIIKID